jgi:putative SOS response-associated peptidase YedK
MCSKELTARPESANKIEVRKSMCGRFTQKFTWSELVELYRLTQSPQNLRPSYNVCPTDPVSVIISGDEGLFLKPMRWQLVPRGWKKPLKELPATFNARTETVASKPIFRDAFKRNRCLIPASGYFEWQTTTDGKLPYYITPRNGPVLTIAGLWEDWRDRVNDETITSCTMIITTANSFVSAIHDRMPVILEPDSIGPWLSGSAGTELLKPTREDALRMWPVSKRVSKPGNGDDPTLIEPVTLQSTVPELPTGGLPFH